ncbi:hypothetical protein [Sulfurimonas sp.]|uniref:hypothetical protein n=1 Tax=Sulfurimonas sp. TaxID=2022749 RepID=UPI00356A4B8C
MKNILMNTEMTKAILEGRKTQTRRVLLDCKEFDIEEHESGFNLIHDYKCRIENVGIFSTKKLLMRYFSDKYSKYKIGDILYVRETFVRGVEHDENDCPLTTEDGSDWIWRTYYRADDELIEWVDEDGENVNVPWKPSIHMPKEYARIFLKVTDVRVERLHDITYADVKKEGLPLHIDIPKEHYNNKIANGLSINPIEHWWINLWNSTAKDGYKWEDNPYVFVYEFERVER